MAIIKGTNKNDQLLDTGSPTDGYDNTILGLGGDDTIYVDKGKDTVDGGDGNDKIYARWVESVRIHREFDDSGNFVATRSETYSDDIQGGDGNDFISLASGQSVVDGGNGYDLVSFQSVSGEVTFSYGNFPAQFDASYDRSAKAVIDLGRGKVTYAGFDMSVDVFHYDPPGSGNRVDDATFTASAIGVMNHTIRNFEGAQGQIGRSDILRGSNLKDVVEIFAPGKGMIPSSQVYNDLVDGRGGVDVVSYAGEIGGVDVNLGRGLAKGIMTVLGGNSFNTFRDRLVGVEGAFGGFADDILRGDDKNNWFSGGGGADEIIGGKGFDIVSYTLGEFGTMTGTGAAGFPWAANGTKGIEVDMTTGAVRDDFGAMDTLSGIEGVFGSVNGDKMLGDGFNNRFWGGAGNDDIQGLGGDDVVQGGDGTDTIDGGEGFDTLDFSNTFPEGGRGVYVTLKTGKAVDPFDTTDTIRNIEKVVGTDLRDIIKGDNRANTLIGGDGRDTLGGLGGKDKLYGGNQRDTLDGGEGNDELYGASGEDRLYGQEGDDILKGGVDDDLLYDDKMTSDTSALFTQVFNMAVNTGGIGDLKTKQLNQLFGEKGLDTLFGVGLLDGGVDNDEIRGGGVLIGGDGNDMIYADPAYTGAFGAFAFVIGGKGNDTIANLGDKTVAVSYQYSAKAITVDMAVGTVDAGPGDHDSLSGVTAVFGSAGDDVFKDDGVMHSYRGEDGDDRFFIEASTDFAIGGDGKDRFVATGDGRAELYGDGDNDTFIIKSRAIRAVGGDGEDKFTVYGRDKPTGHLDSLQYILDGGKNTDTFVLNNATSTEINAGQGNDRIEINGGFAGGSGTNYISIKLGIGRDTVKLSGKNFSVEITDFRPNEDRLGVVGAMPKGVDTFAEIVVRADDVAGDVVISLSDGVVRLADLTVDDLTAGMFIF